MSFDLISLVGLFLTVIALTVALLQTRGVVRQGSLLRRHSASLEEIIASLSTRYLGVFPSYLYDVVNWLELTQREVRIVVGNPAPAYFSDPSVWLAYKQVIERKVHAGVAIRMICMSEPLRRKRLGQQFPVSEEQWPVWLGRNRERLADFLRHRCPEREVDELCCADLQDLLVQTQNDVIKDLRLRGVEIVEVDQWVSLQAWIADGVTAIFAIQTSEAQIVSHGLYTSDGRFVDALLAMIDLYN